MLLLELVLFVNVFRNLKLFADVVEGDLRYRVFVVVVIAVGCRCRITSVAVAIGNDDAIGRRRSRRYVGRQRASQLIDDVRMRMMECALR